MEKAVTDVMGIFITAAALMGPLFVVPKILAKLKPNATADETGGWLACIYLVEVVIAIAIAGIAN